MVHGAEVRLENELCVSSPKLGEQFKLVGVLDKSERRREICLRVQEEL